MPGGDVGPQEDVFRVGYLEQRFPEGSQFSRFGIFGQNRSAYRGGDMAFLELVFDLCYLDGYR